MKKKKEEYVLHDFGEVTIAEDWSEVTLGQFQKIMKLTNADNAQIDVRDLISVLTGKDKEWVNLLPARFVQSLMVKLVFLNKAPEAPATNILRWKGEEYKVNFLNELTFGEYTDINTLISSDPNNYAGFLAILCRKEGEVYNDEFTAHIEDRVRLFEEVPVTDVLPVISFFLHLWGTSEAFSPASLRKTADLAETLLQDIDSSRKNGAYRRLPISFRAKVWWKLRKYRKCLQRLSCSISAS